MSHDTTLFRDKYPDDTHLDYDPDSGFSKRRGYLPQARSHDEYGYDEFTRWVNGHLHSRKDDEIDDMEDTIF